MHWATVDLTGSKHKLLTSDRPIVMPFGLGNRQAYIAIPISPKMLFVAAYNDRFRRQLPSVNKTAVVKVVNKDVVMQAREFVWGVDAESKTYVEKHIGKQPDRVILSEVQKQESIDVARGLGN